MAGADSRYLLRLHRSVDRKEAQAGHGCSVLHPVGVLYYFSQHLHTAADTHDEPLAGVIDYQFAQTLGVYPGQVISGLLAAWNDDDVRMVQLLWGATEEDRNRRFSSQGIKVSEVGE